MKATKIQIEFHVVAFVRQGGGGRCRAMTPKGACLNAARWSAVSAVSGRDIPVCRMHGNKAERTGMLAAVTRTEPRVERATRGGR